MTQIQKILTEGSPEDIISSFKFDIRRNDVALLAGQSWLNDEVCLFLFFEPKIVINLFQQR